MYPVCERRSAENMIKDRSLPYQHNFRAETLAYASVVEPIDQPSKFHISRTKTADIERIKTARDGSPVQRGVFRRTEEMPSHPKIVDAVPWNNGTKFTEKDSRKFLKLVTEKARVSSTKISKRLNSSQDYVKPMDQSAKLSKDIRKKKKAGTYTTPFATENEKNAGNAVLNGKSTSDEKVGKDEFKNRYSVEPSRKYRTTQHSGVWEYSKPDGRYMWSDTGSFVYESRGDLVTNFNPDSFNLENPTLPKPFRTDLVDSHHVDHR